MIKRIILSLYNTFYSHGYARWIYDILNYSSNWLINRIEGKHVLVQNACKYCYANHSSSAVNNNLLHYNADFALLCSSLTNADKISERAVKSLRNAQLNLY